MGLAPPFWKKQLATKTSKRDNPEDIFFLSHYS
jgi:hypothetical protein